MIPLRCCAFGWACNCRKVVLESAVKTLGIGLEIQDSSGEVVFSNAIMEKNREAVTLGGRTREGFYFWEGQYYRKTEFQRCRR